MRSRRVACRKQRDDEKCSREEQEAERWRAADMEKLRRVQDNENRRNCKQERKDIVMAERAATDEQARRVKRQNAELEEKLERESASQRQLPLLTKNSSVA